MVKVLPEPVTPSSVCAARPDSMPSTRRAMASGWSPAGSYCAASSNRPSFIQWNSVLYRSMNIAVSRRVQRVKPSPTLSMTARAAQLRRAGKDVISLSVGEPDFDTPAHIRAAGVAAIEAGHTRYTNSDGAPELKDAIIAKFQRDNGLAYQRYQILVSTGAKQTLFNLCLALIDPGDEVVIPAPYWVSYPDMVLLADGVPVTPYAGAGQGFKIT